ncbi:receptor-type tyrosine-protein phosphatase alpha-like [Babylonia areolata]|uniref:receptor-type tyrosine-protein phosphatase alpha-like n=1 Tax=Babylonia areolata TaxID=304850 RepID=UPI003FD3FCE2
MNPRRRRKRAAKSPAPAHPSSELTHIAHKKDARPQAQVKPSLKPKPKPADPNIYQNAVKKNGTGNGAAGAGSPPQKVPKPLPGAEKPLPASKEPLTEDEEMDAEWSGEQIYNNDPSLFDSFVPATFRLDQLQKTIVDSLQDDTVADEFKTLVEVKEYPLSSAQRKENYYKNRFNSILPYDKTRVVLEQVDGDDASDYINASFVKGYKTEKAYIASQGPRSNTQDDFWRMVWQEGVTDIVMLTNLKEGSKAKCHEYWPEKGKSLNTGHVEVAGLEVEERAHFVTRTFNIKKLQGQEKRQVRQYHYVKWMDHEVPTTTPLVDFWRYIRARAPRTPTAPPLLVHCSAGVGRTGTYIALDILMDQSQEEETISLYTTVSNLRDYRCHMVQNKGQYEFLHEAVLAAYMSGDSRLDTSSFDRIFSSTIRHDQPQPRIDAEFKRLCQMRTCLTHPSHTLASQEENQAKNRNPDALPDDNHIVYITQHAKGRTQYINAVYMPTFLSARGSIVTQLPLADTVIDLWRLVDSWDVTTIVSLGQVKGHKDMCAYWPRGKEQPVSCGAYEISLVSMNPLGDSLFTYTLDMKKTDKSREVRVLHYEAWTGEVADNIPDLLCLLDILHTSHKEPTKQPVIIQCLDGVAKSGVVCALWDAISRMTYDGEADVYLAARHVHTVRPEAITSVVQYRFMYEVIQQHRNSQNIYANT